MSRPLAADGMGDDALRGTRSDTELGYDACQHACCCISSCGLWAPVWLGTRCGCIESCQHPCEPDEDPGQISWKQQGVACVVSCGLWLPCLIGTCLWGLAPRPFGMMCIHCFPTAFIDD